MPRKPKPPKRGRPPLPEGQERSRIVQVRVRPDEHARITRAAEKAGKALSEWIRDALLRAAE